MTKEELMKVREDLDAVLMDQLSVAIGALDAVGPAAIATGTAKTILHYVQDLRRELGVPSHGYPFVPGEEPTYYDNEDEAPDYKDEKDTVKAEPDTKTTIEDIVAEEVKAVLDQPQTVAEEPALTKEEVTNVLRGLQLKHTTEPNLITDTLKEFGATKLSQVPPEKYGDLVAAAKAKVGET